MYALHPGYHSQLRGDGSMRAFPGPNVPAIRACRAPAVAPIAPWQAPGSARQGSQPPELHTADCKLWLLAPAARMLAPGAGTLCPVDGQLSPLLLAPLTQHVCRDLHAAQPVQLCRAGAPARGWRAVGRRPGRAAARRADPKGFTCPPGTAVDALHRQLSIRSCPGHQRAELLGTEAAGD